MQVLQSVLQKMQSPKVVFWSAGILGITFLVLCWVLGKTQKVDLLAQAEQIVPYGDWDEEGDSQGSFVENDGILNLKGVLGKQKEWPYVGLSLRLGPTDPDSSRSCLDLHKVDTILVKIRAQNTEQVNLQMIDRMPAGNAEPFRLLELGFPVHEEWRTLRIPVEELQIPNWWKVKHQLAVGPQPRYRDQVCRLDFVVGSPTLRHKEFRVEIAQIEVDLPRNPLYFWLGIVSLMAWVFWGMMLVQKRKLLKQVIQNQELAEHIPVEVPEFMKPSSQWEPLQKWLLDQYSDPDCSAQKTAEALKLSERKIGELVKEHTGLGFREYLVHLRLKEAKRLLVESEVQIQQVALLAGFGHISHFNRVFKDKEGLSPREWRQKQKAAPE
jgi:AraC-like DNA-binding protein